jgi:hypothetical protein
MKLEKLVPILNVSNIVETFAWFEKLGWKKGWDWGEPPTFGAVQSGECEIFLCQNGQGARGGAKPQFVGDDGTGGVWMSWFLDSPTDEPWGVREFHLRHPDGHTFRVGAGTEEE